MKTMKRIFTLVMTLALIVTMSLTSMAATQIKTDSSDLHYYDVYQVFTGDYAVDTHGLVTLSNLKWGVNGINNGTPITVGDAVPDAVADALKAVTDETDNLVKLAVIKKYVVIDPANKVGTVHAGSSLTVDPGYYVLVDTGHAGGVMGVDEGKSIYVTEIVGDITIAAKKGTTTFKKKVLDVEGTTENWQDSADYDIGDDVPFRLTAELATDLHNYTAGYKLTFHDTLSSGLTFNPTSVEVKHGTSPIANSFYTVDTAPSDGCSFHVSFDNVKAISSSITGGDEISVEYTAKLNPSAKIGYLGNPNVANITFSNDPNLTTPNEEGKSTEDKVTVFTYALTFDKYANAVASGNELDGATFTLYKAEAPTVPFMTVDGSTSHTFTFTGLDAGSYILKETVTPVGFNTMADLHFTITASHDVLSDNPQLTNLNADVAVFNPEMTSGHFSGVISGNLINHSGATLPSTGGIGTPIFYVTGSILVLGAFVFFVTKRRMAKRK